MKVPAVPSADGTTAGCSYSENPHDVPGKAKIELDGKRTLTRQIIRLETENVKLANSANSKQIPGVLRDPRTYPEFPTTPVYCKNRGSVVEY
jgi:hypothetical protein